MGICKIIPSNKGIELAEHLKLDLRRLYMKEAGEE